MSKIKIVEQYQNYFPPVHVYGALQVLLRYVPDEHLAGLRRIILTNSEVLRDRVKGKIISEKQRIRPSDCQGLYRDGEILLLMDRIFESCPEILLVIPIFKTYLIGKTLYHEIGHHIHRMQEPGFRDRKEAVADEWKESLMRIFLRQRYWYLRGILKLFEPLLRPMVAKAQCEDTQ